jgi:hypothetical protein
MPWTFIVEAEPITLMSDRVNAFFEADPLHRDSQLID